MTLNLLSRFAQAREPLPAETLAGLLAVAGSRPGPDPLRACMIARADVTMAQALALVTHPMTEAQVAAYTSRADVSLAEAVRLLREADPATRASVASRTTRPALLTWLVATAGEHVSLLLSAARNEHTPLEDAVSAVSRVVEIQSADPAATAATYQWLNGLADPVVTAWAATSRDLIPLTTAVKATAVKALDVSEELLAHLAEVALAAIPAGETELEPMRAVVAALMLVSNHGSSTRELRERVAQSLDARGVTIREKDAVEHLKLRTDSQNRALPLLERSWRKASSKALSDPRMAAELAAVLGEQLGANPAAWRMLDELGPAFRGTVKDLTTVARGVGAPGAGALGLG